MNCPQCNQEMANHSDYSGDMVRVLHSCEACDFKYGVGFPKPVSEFNPFQEKKAMNKIGHVLNTTFNNQPVSYTVIAQRRNHLGRICYVLNEWNEISCRFLEISEDSYHFQMGKASFSALPHKLNKAQSAMQKAYRLSLSIRKLNKLIRGVGVGLVDTHKLTAFTSYRGQFDMHDKSGYHFMLDEPEFLFGDVQTKERLVKMRNKRIEAWQNAMQSAGIIR